MRPAQQAQGQGSGSARSKSTASLLGDHQTHIDIFLRCTDVLLLLPLVVVQLSLLFLLVRFRQCRRGCFCLLTSCAREICLSLSFLASTSAALRLVSSSIFRRAASCLARPISAASSSRSSRSLSAISYEYAHVHKPADK